MANETHIKKCNGRQCGTCPFLEETQFFHSNSTGQRFKPSLADQSFLTCKSENVIYMIFCKVCNIQYIGETKQKLIRRFSNHKTNINGKKSGQIVHKHFEERGHGISNLRVIPIESINKDNVNLQNLNEVQKDKAITKYRQDREKFWISKLQTAYPLGLNVTVKGVGDFNVSQGQYQNFEGRRRRKNKKHSRRKPKRLRNNIGISLDFIKRKHIELRDKDNYIHFFKTFLYGLPRNHLQTLQINAKQDSLLDDRLRDMINMISHQKLFQPVQTYNKKDRDFYHIQFRDKGLDHINISQILRNNSVTDKIPIYFIDKEPPIIGYKFNRSIAGNIFNYKESLSEESIGNFENGDIQCSCQNSIYRNDHHGHIITGNLEIIQNSSLKKIFKKGPKYRLPQKIDWTEDKNLIINFLNSYIDNWTAKEKKQGNTLVKKEVLGPWKKEILRIVDNKITRGKILFKRTWSQKLDGDLATELEKLKKDFVITVADKAQNNILFTCKYFYIKSLKEELTRPGQLTYQLTDKGQNDINRDIINFSKNKGIKVPEEMGDLPLIYWIPKMHKNPIGSRFIAGSKFCSIKMLSKHFSKALKLILNHMKLYNRTVFERTGLNCFWILDNSLEFLEKMKSERIDHMETYDFSTLYTALPHGEIKRKFSTIFQKVFNREARPYISFNLHGAYFSITKVNRYSFRSEDMQEILEFILDNIYVRYGKDVYKQVIGIPIGLDSGQDIANLLLYSYESDYVGEISKIDLSLARKFRLNGRYIDDLFVANFPTFRDHIYRIYPRDLEIKLESNNTLELTYLDLKIKSENSLLNFSVYDKRDDFSFDIVNFPFIDSCIPKKSALGVFYSQLIRYARLSSKYADFLIRSNSLVIKLMTQGYRKNELKRLTSRFFRNKQDILTKYNIPNLEDFLKSVFH